MPYILPTAHPIRYFWPFEPRSSCRPWLSNVAGLGWQSRQSGRHLRCVRSNFHIGATIQAAPDRPASRSTTATRQRKEEEIQGPIQVPGRVQRRPLPPFDERQGILFTPPNFPLLDLRSNANFPGQQRFWHSNEASPQHAQTNGDAARPSPAGLHCGPAPWAFPGHFA